MSQVNSDGYAEASLERNLVIKDATKTGLNISSEKVYLLLAKARSATKINNAPANIAIRKEAAKTLM